MIWGPIVHQIHRITRIHHAICAAWRITGHLSGEKLRRHSRGLDPGGVRVAYGAGAGAAPPCGLSRAAAVAFAAGMLLNRIVDYLTVPFITSCARRTAALVSLNIAYAITEH